jgi:hypothetical protein
MKRYAALKYLLDNIDPSDAVIVVGSDLCKEVHQYDDQRILYLPNDIEQSFSLAAGIAMVKKKKIFFICDDHQLLRNLTSAVQAGAARLANVIIVVFITATYQSVDQMPNIFKTFSRPKSVLFDMGFTTHDYSKSYKTADGARDTKYNLQGVKGPISIFLEVDQGIKALPDIDLSLKDNLKRFIDFLALPEEN